ncbi:bifunctional metallophosphatase/5'-nucleotidase [Jiangella endophytica]|uniref:bifunctional metallophosphatase/5'-nucleotidase n=1 Tax=Jiangella endophytica TaxID=1623398 RepID=UPI000E35496A|nr:bifunctional metallophosphatase/5'-nucleotidase [Jiangella endophytica]
MRRTTVLTAAAALALTGAVAPAATADQPVAETVPVQLLSITDFHGYFGDYTASIRGAQAGDPAQTVGGGVYLATHLKQLAAGQPNSILFSAGDDFSGWPDETEFFWNEPTIEYLDAIGLEFSTVGNHEMDRGFAFLDHLRNGTCEGRPDDDLCFTDSTGRVFDGAEYDYYSANLIDRATGEPALSPSHIQYVDDGAGGTLPIGFVHATTSLTSSEQMSYTPAGYDYAPEVAAINAATAALRGQGVEAIVVVLHEGFSQQAGAGYDDCVAPFGPAVDFNREIDPAVDAIVTGHWHGMANCFLPDPDGVPRPIVQGGNHGHLISEIGLELDADTGDVVRDRTTSDLHPNTQDVAPDPEAARIAGYWRAQLAERNAAEVATITGDIRRAPGDAAESPAYNLAADAFLWAANQDGAADLAVAMPGILRADLTYAPTPTRPGDAPGRVLFPELAVGVVYDSGIGVGLVRGTVTGRDVLDLLESQWQAGPNGTVTFRSMAVSGNVTYTYDSTRPLGRRVVPGSVRIDGRPLRPGGDYRVATLANNFFAKNATPGFTALFDARDQDRSLFNGGDALWRYAEAHSPLAPPEVGRASAR